MPKPDAIAQMVTEVIAKTINESNKSELIAKYKKLAPKADRRLERIESAVSRGKSKKNKIVK